MPALFRGNPYALSYLPHAAANKQQERWTVCCCTHTFARGVFGSGMCGVRVSGCPRLVFNLVCCRILWLLGTCPIEALRKLKPLLLTSLKPPLLQLQNKEQKAAGSAPCAPTTFAPSAELQASVCRKSLRPCHAMALLRRNCNRHCMPCQ